MARFMKYVNAREVRESKVITLYYRYHAGNDMGFLWIENGRSNVKFKFSSNNIKSDMYGNQQIRLQSKRYLLFIKKNVFDGECVFRDNEEPKNNMNLHLNSIPKELFKLQL